MWSCISFSAFNLCPIETGLPGIAQTAGILQRPSLPFLMILIIARLSEFGLISDGWLESLLYISSGDWANALCSATQPRLNSRQCLSRRWLLCYITCLSWPHGLSTTTSSSVLWFIWTSLNWYLTNRLRSVMLAPLLQHIWRSSAQSFSYTSPVQFAHGVSQHCRKTPTTTRDGVFSQLGITHDVYQRSYLSDVFLV